MRAFLAKNTFYASRSNPKANTYKLVRAEILYFYVTFVSKQKINDIMLWWLLKQITISHGLSTCSNVVVVVYRI